MSRSRHGSRTSAGSQERCRSWSEITSKMLGRMASASRIPRSVLASVAVGGALGAPARYGVTQLINVPKDGFPWATFSVNVTGSFALGVVLTLLLERLSPTRHLRPFLATGFLGAYTTYSTFAVDTDVLAKDGHPLRALLYVGATLLAGFLAVWAGIAAARLGRSPAPVST
jgi:CrcB protein